MKKAARKFICVLILLALLTGCTGCRSAVRFAADFIDGAKSAVFATSSPSASDSPKASASGEDDAKNRVKFYNDGEEPVYLSKTKIGNYQSPYSAYMSDYYKQQLSQEELLAYNALLYAMEHHFTHIVLRADTYSFDFYRARDALALDSPFLEQNYRSGEGCTAVGLAMCYTMEDFTEESWTRKMQALAKAEKIVAAMPAEADTDMERMEYIYDYVRKNVQYRAYGDSSESDYLYDALCGGVTICDGYSNALALLFQTAGIACCETMGCESEDEDADGHTWVVASIDGTFYNFDATSDTEEDDGYGDYRCYFGVSDEVMDMDAWDQGELRPVCNDKSRDLLMTDGRFRDMLSYETEREAAWLCNNRAEAGKMSTLLGFAGDYTEENVESFIDVYIELLEYGESIEYVSMYNTGRTLVLITIKE